MDPCNASDLLCVNISGQLFIIECVDFFCINLRRAAAGVCAMKTLLSCFSHFWASCKMLLHLLCLQCNTVCGCTAQHSSSMQQAHLNPWTPDLTAAAAAAALCQLWNILAAAKFFQHFAPLGNLAEILCSDNFQIPLFVLSPIHNDGLRQPHCQNRKNVMQSSLTFYNKQIQK